MSVKQVFNTSAELDYPTVLPTLDLDFANSKTLDSRITFTRASGGSYVGADGLIKLAGVNEARFDHNPYTGESLGLLIEESRTNLTTYSEQFDNAAWGIVSNGITVNTTSTTSPTGATNGNQITNNSNSNNFNYTYQAYTSSTKGAYTFSLFVKDNDISKISIIVGTDSFVANFARTIYTFSTQSFSSYQYAGTPTGYVSSSTSTSYPNGWYKLSITFGTTSFASQTSLSVGIYPGVYGSTAASYTKSFYVWGAQLETGAFPTSYIPTVASTVTRSADNASITGTNFSSFYNQTEGSVYCRYNRMGIQAASTTVPTPWGVSDGTFSNSMSLVGGYGVPNSRRFDILISGSTTAQLDFGSQFAETANTFYKSAVCYKLNDIAGTVNANSVLTDTSSNIPTVNVLCIGRRDPASLIDYLNGSISQLTYYPRRLTNTQLQNLTK